MIEDSVDTFEKTRAVQIFLSEGAVFFKIIVDIQSKYFLQVVDV